MINMQKGRKQKTAKEKENKRQAGAAGRGFLKLVSLAPPSWVAKGRVFGVSCQDKLKGLEVLG